MGERGIKRRITGGQRWYIRTSSSIPPFLGIYPNFVYLPYIGGISELVGI